MKINEYINGAGNRAYTGEAQQKPKDVAAKNQQEMNGAGSKGDKVQLSERSKEIVRAQEIAREAPDIRAEKVAEIKAKLESGTYDANAKAVADKLLKSMISETV